MKTSVYRAAVLVFFNLSVSVSLVLPGHSSAHAPVQERIAILGERITQDPDNAELYLARGELYRVHREWSSSHADFKRAAELDPKLAEIDLYLGKLFLASNRLNQAENTLKQFLMRHPRHTEAKVSLAQVLLQLDRRVEAAKEFTKAIELHPRPNPEWYLERAKALSGAGDEYLDEALTGLDQGLQRLGPVITLQLYAIDLELSNNRHDAALARLGKIAAQSSRKETWLLRRGEILEKAGRTDEAHEAFTRALAAAQKLPRHRQETPAMTKLKTRIIDSLKRIKTDTRASVKQ